MENPNKHQHHLNRHFTTDEKTRKKQDKNTQHRHERIQKNNTTSQTQHRLTKQKSDKCVRYAIV